MDLSDDYRYWQSYLFERLMHLPKPSDKKKIRDELGKCIWRRQKPDKVVIIMAVLFNIDSADTRKLYFSPEILIGQKQIIWWHNKHDPTLIVGRGTWMN